MSGRCILPLSHPLHISPALPGQPSGLATSCFLYPELSSPSPPDVHVLPKCHFLWELLLAPAELAFQPLALIFVVGVTHLRCYFTELWSLPPAWETSAGRIDCLPSETDSVLQTWGLGHGFISVHWLKLCLKGRSVCWGRRHKHAAKIISLPGVMGP